MKKLFALTFLLIAFSCMVAQGDDNAVPSGESAGTVFDDLELKPEKIAPKEIWFAIMPNPATQPDVYSLLDKTAVFVQRGGEFVLAPAFEVRDGERVMAANEVSDAIKYLKTYNDVLEKEYLKLKADFDKLREIYIRELQAQAHDHARSQPSQDNSDLLNLMMMQQLFPHTSQPLRINVQTMDCTKYPALCVSGPYGP